MQYNAITLDLDFYHIIFESTGTAMIIFDENTNILLVNNEFVSLSGYAKEEIEAKISWTKFIVENDLEKLKRIHFMRNLDYNAPPRKYEFAIRTKEGDIREVLASISSIPQTKHYIGSFIDITERKKAEKQVTNILESITDSFFSVDKNWCITYVNKQAEKFFMKPASKVLNKNFWEAFPLGVGTKLYHDLHMAMGSDSTSTFEHKGIRSARCYDVNAYPSNEGLSVYFRDVTEKRALEKEIARFDRLNLIGEMSAGISHEIRNPLTTVRGFLQLLHEKEVSTNLKSYYDLMITELDRANSIITEFLSLAHHKAINLKKNNLNDILGALYPLILADALKNNKNIILQQQEIPEILVDEKEIRQLILNLVRNGFEAMDPGGNLTVSTTQIKQEVVLTIQDQGKGIDAKLQDKIGTPFFTTKDDGTGLGLAVCYSIANRHNAVLDFESSKEGTTFFVRFKQ